MNERTMLAETAARLLRDIASTPALTFAAAWQRAVNLGLPLLMVEEAAGGFGGSWTDLSIVQLLARDHRDRLRG